MGRTMLVAVSGLVVVVSCSPSATTSTASTTAVTTEATTTSTEAPSTTSTLPVEVFEARMDDLLVGSALLEPSAVLYEATWGSGEGQIGYHRAEDGNYGPCCFASTADTWVIIDSTNHRMIISENGANSYEGLEVRYPIGVGMVGDTLGIAGSKSVATVDEFVFYSLTERKYTDRRSPGQGFMVSGVVAEGEKELWFAVSDDDPEPGRSEGFWTTGLDDRLIEGRRRPLTNGWFLESQKHSYYTTISLLDPNGSLVSSWRLIGQAYPSELVPAGEDGLVALVTGGDSRGVPLVRFQDDGIELIGLIPAVDDPEDRLVYRTHVFADARTLRVMEISEDGVRLVEYRF